ncbi:MAG TPA: hypothetical protein ENH01_00310 [Nitrospirae bacterium]|nr:hypothetical protein [Nitrospirota bacterium]
MTPGHGHPMRGKEIDPMRGKEVDPMRWAWIDRQGGLKAALPARGHESLTGRCAGVEILF